METEQIEQYRKDGEIRTMLMIHASLCRERQFSPNRDPGYPAEHIPILLAVAAATDRIRDLVKEFEAKHWLPKIQEYYRNSRSHRHAAQTVDYKVGLLGSAGRVLIELQDQERHGKFGGAWLTMIFDETSPIGRGGIQGLCATESEAALLLRAAIETFPELRPA